MNRDEYEVELKKRQQEHLQLVHERHQVWKPCRHAACPECVGTGVKLDGYPCIHNISCDCAKCKSQTLKL
jgi:hypothetical protein